MRRGRVPGVGAGAFVTVGERYSVLYADPPWRFGDKLPGKGRGAAKHYNVMTASDICAMELPPLADDCVLFMWRVSAMQQEALDVMRAWGFTLKTEAVWAKVTKHGKRHFGMGRILRAEHEVCLVGTRGRPKVNVKNIRSVVPAGGVLHPGGREFFEVFGTPEVPAPFLFQAKVGKHSKKPDEMYEIIETLYDGPYVELFARQTWPGWHAIGDEV